MDNQENNAGIINQGTIVGSQCWPGPQGQPGKVDPDFDYTKLSKFRCVLVGNKQYDQLVNGNLYLVYRKHEQTGEPTYSLCTYENGCWIPYGIIESIKSLPWFTGIPVEDADYWIGVNELFKNIDNTEEPGEPEKQNIEEESKKKETVQEYVERRRKEIEQEEQERRRKADQENFDRIRRGEYTPHSMPITPSSESQAIHELNITIGILMEYIQKMQDDIIDEPVIEKNWEHLKNFTNDMLDRIIKLEEKIGSTPFPYIPPVSPYPNPFEPITPSPITPGNPWPYGPIVTYSVPGALPGGITLNSLFQEYSITGDK